MVRSRHPSGGAVGRATHTTSSVDFATHDQPLYSSQSDMEAVTAVDMGPGSVIAGVIAPNTVGLSEFTQNIRPVAIVGTLPTLPDSLYPIGATVVYTVDGKLYRNVADVWAKAVDGVDLVADSVTAGAIAAGAVSTSELAAGAITTDKIGVGQVQSRNMIPNPSFETTTGWGAFRSTEVPTAGAYNGKIFHGGQEYLVSSQFDVVGGHKYLASIQGRGHSGNTANRNLGFSVRWFDNAGVQIGTDTTVDTLAYGTQNPYRAFRGYVTAPATAVRAFVFAFHNNPGDASHQSYWDDAEFYDAAEDVNHAGGNVIIDSTGIYIKDEFSTTGLTTAGFSGNWQNFLSQGLYNGSFQYGIAGTIALGRTVSLPYWTLTRSGSGTMTYTAPGSTGNGLVSNNFSALSDTLTLTSDIVTCEPRTNYLVNVAYSYNTTAGTTTLTCYVDFYKNDGVTLAASRNYQVAAINVASVGGLSWTHSEDLVSTDESYYMKVRLEWAEAGTHNAANRISCWGLIVQRHALEPALTGASFPSPASVGDRFFRVDIGDHGLWFIYNGTYWLSEHLFTAQGIPEDNALPWTATTKNMRFQIESFGATDAWIEEAWIEFFVVGGTALSASHKWVGSSLFAYNIDSGVSSAWRTGNVAIDALASGFPRPWQQNWAKTGTPGNLYLYITITYRLRQS